MSNPLSGNRLAAICLGLVGGLAVVMALLTAAVYQTTDPNMVQTIGGILGPIGLVAAALCGLAFASFTANQARRPSDQTYGGPIMITVVFWGIGALCLWIGNAIPVMWIAVLLAFLLGLIPLLYQRQHRVPPVWLRYILILGAFIGGAFPGLVLYIILSFIVSDRYCQLTSSKCM